MSAGTLFQRYGDSSGCLGTPPNHRDQLPRHPRLPIEFGFCAVFLVTPPKLHTGFHPIRLPSSDILFAYDPNITVGEPEKRRLPWFWGVKDGDPATTPVFPPFEHPPLPRVQERHDERVAQDRRDRERRDRVDEHPDFHDMFGRRRDDHDDDRDRSPKDQRHDGGERGRRQDATRQHRSWSPRHWDDGYDGHGGRRREADAPRRDPATRREHAPTRELTRSPRPADGHNPVQDADVAAKEQEARRQRDLKLMFHLKAATLADVATKMLNLQGHKNTTSPCLPLKHFSTLSRLVDELGDEVWFDYNNKYNYKAHPPRSHQPVPVRRAFYRIKRALPVQAPPTIDEVNAALSKMTSPVNVQMDDEVPQPQAQEAQLPPTDGHVEQQHTPIPAATMPVNNDEPTAQTPQVCLASPSAHLNGVAELFSTPEQGLISQPPPVPGKRGRRLRKSPVAVASLRRSKRQACSRLKHLPAEQRASHVLCRRLGYIKDDLTPAEQAIQEFVATFKGPMPQFIVAGLTAMFRLDDDDICSATAALIRLGGQEAAGTLPEANEGV
ncbi:unnamed protein product [Urochloa humidicola]